MYWINFLHIYQPPNQKRYWVDKVTEESYRRILRELERAPRAKMTMNMSACLGELLVRYGHHDVIRSLQKLMARGQLELTGSAKYHPFLPKLPTHEVERQIDLNVKTLRKILGPVYAPRGFFPPEMAVTPTLARTIARLGYTWVIADEAAFPGNTLDTTTVYTVKGTRLAIFFRERSMSFKILSAQLGTGSLLLRDLGDRLTKNEYMLTAMDGETFGHHRLGLEKLLFDIYRSSALTTVTLSHVLEIFSKRTVVTPLPSSWALLHKDLAKKAPFSRWDDRTNAIHRSQWQLTALAIRAVHQALRRGDRATKARNLLDAALHSDQYWWASAKPWWSLENIEAGAFDLLTAVRAIPRVSHATLARAKDFYDRIIFTGFRWQRAGIVDALVREHYDEEVAERLDTTVPTMRTAEFKRIVDHLRDQMRAAAKDEEYDRAQQFKKRILELEEQRKQEAGKRWRSTEQPKQSEGTAKSWGI
ncbi:hypothetical protein HY629_00315 [Candidatus Uhrbacteria bacterium]|nr:hypothetical protein [Candidatus Uhrbacteria bacterium]